MAQRSVLAQTFPGLGIISPAYTAGVGVIHQFTGVVVCNQDSVDSTFSVSYAVAGAVSAPEQYLFYNVAICANETVTLSVAIVMEDTDEIRVTSGNGLLSFTILGVEVT